MEIKIDDIFAALMLSLVTMRRIEVKAATPEQNPGVSPERFHEWRTLALKAYDQVAVACVAKVVLSLGWYALGMRLGVGFPWFQLGGFFVFVAWAAVLVWAWKLGTDARQLRLQLGIRRPGRSSAAT